MCLYPESLLSAVQFWTLLPALFLTGLAGGFGHCVGMCGPFVLAQVGGGLASRPVLAGGLALARAGRGVLMPYHLGRMTTYTTLGAIAGGLSGMVVQATQFKPLVAVLLAGAALLFLLQAIHGLARWMPALAGFPSGLPTGLSAAPAPHAELLTRAARPLLRRPGWASGYGLGVLLGFLPCGLVYAALASAVGMGSALGGAAAMAAFALGTMPSLVAVGALGSLAGSRWTAAMRALAPPLMLVNAGLLIAFAWRLAG